MDAMLNWLWQGSVVALAAFAMLLALKRARANVRYVVCWCAVLLTVALPGLASLQSAAMAGDVVAETPRAAIVSLPFSWWTSALVILVAWIVWAGVQGFRFLSAVVAIRHARAHHTALPARVESLLPRWRLVRQEGRRVTLVLSDAVATAAVLSWGHPIIAVAPALVNTLDADDLDRILVHEWAHVQRRDDLANILQIVVRIFAGWHPAVWLLERRLQVEREIACDEMAVAITGSAKSYAACLVKLATLRGALREIRTAPAALSPSGLRARVVKILSPSPSIAPVWSRGIAAAIVTALALISAGLGGIPLVEAADEMLPAVWPHLRETPLSRLAPVSAPVLTIAGPSRAPRETIAPRGQSPQTSTTTAPSASPERTTSDPSSASAAASALPSTPIARTVDHPVVAPPSGLPRALANPSTAAIETSQSPWEAAAAGGAAIGKKATDAGVATAGFFTRMARRVAGSF